LGQDAALPSPACALSLKTSLLVGESPYMGGELGSGLGEGDSSAVNVIRWELALRLGFGLNWGFSFVLFVFSGFCFLLAICIDLVTRVPGSGTLGAEPLFPSDFLLDEMTWRAIP